MIRRPPRSTRTVTLFPDTTLFRSVLSILLMHGFVFAMQFKNEPSLPEGTPWWSAFARFTLPGYVLALLISLFILWIFGRTDGLGRSEEHTSELQSLMRSSSAVFCLKKKQLRLRRHQTNIKHL